MRTTKKHSSSCFSYTLISFLFLNTLLIRSANGRCRKHHTPPTRSEEESRSCNMRTTSPRQQEARGFGRPHQRRCHVGKTLFFAEKVKTRRTHSHAGEAKRPAIVCSLRFRHLRIPSWDGGTGTGTGNTVLVLGFSDS